MATNVLTEIGFCLFRTEIVYFSTQQNDAFYIV